MGASCSSDGRTLIDLRRATSPSRLIELESDDEYLSAGGDGKRLRRRTRYNIKVPTTDERVKQRYIDLITAPPHRVKLPPRIPDSPMPVEPRYINKVVIGRVKPSEVEPVYAQLKKKKRLSKPTIVAPIFSHLTPLHIANNSDSPGMRSGVRPLVGRIMKPQSAPRRDNQKPTLIDLKPLNIKDGHGTSLAATNIKYSLGTYPMSEKIMLKQFNVSSVSDAYPVMGFAVLSASTTTVLGSRQPAGTPSPAKSANRREQSPSPAQAANQRGRSTSPAQSANHRGRSASPAKSTSVTSGSSVSVNRTRSGARSGASERSSSGDTDSRGEAALLVIEDFASDSSRPTTRRRVSPLSTKATRSSTSPRRKTHRPASRGSNKGGKAAPRLESIPSVDCTEDNPTSTTQAWISALPHTADETADSDIMYNKAEKQLHNKVVEYVGAILQSVVGSMTSSPSGSRSRSTHDDRLRRADEHTDTMPAQSVTNIAPKPLSALPANKLRRVEFPWERVVTTDDSELTAAALVSKECTPTRRDRPGDRPHDKPKLQNKIEAITLTAGTKTLPLVPLNVTASIDPPDTRTADCEIIGGVATVYVNNYEGNFLYYVYSPHKQMIYFDCFRCKVNK